MAALKRMGIALSTAACLLGGPQNAIAAEGGGTSEVTLIYDPSWERAEQMTPTAKDESLAQTGDAAAWITPLLISIGMLTAGYALRKED